MFKKLFNSIMGNSQEEEKQPSSQETQSTMYMINDSNQTMITAIAEARKTLPDYLKYYENAPKYTFNHRVKCHFKDGDGSDEHIWLIPFSVNGNEITGIVGNQPQIVECVEGGEEVTVPMNDISDWGFQAGSEQIGNYTVYAMFTEMHPNEVQSYIHNYGFTRNPLDKKGISFAELIDNLDTTMPETEELTEVTYDPETLHGTHYSVADFDAEAKRRADEFIAEEEADGEKLDDADKKSILSNARKELYFEVNGCDDDQYVKWFNRTTMGNMGVSSDGQVTIDQSNPLLVPVNGISLEDYVAMTKKTMEGVDIAEICKAMNVTEADYTQAMTTWNERMSNDTTITVATLYGTYFADTKPHPKLANLSA